MLEVDSLKNDLVDRGTPDPASGVLEPSAHHTSAPLERAGRELSLITRTSEISSLRNDWRRLLPKESSPFSTFDWVNTWYHAFEDHCNEILVFVITQGNKTKSILPCYRQGRKIRLAGDITCDYQDLIVGNEYDAFESLSLIFEWLNIERPGSELYFKKVSSRGALMRALDAFSSSDSGIFLFRKNFMPCPCVKLSGSLEEYLQSIPRKPRSEFRRVVNRLEREVPDAEVVIWKGEDVVRGQLTRAAEFHVRHFRKGGESPLADPRLIALLHHVAGSDEVGLRVSVLRNGEDILAVDFGFCRGGSFYGYLTDFDESYSHLSPGRCLFIKRIDHWIHQEKITTLDLLGGGEKYKKGYTGGEFYQVSTVRIQPRNFVGGVRFAMIRSNRALRQIVKKVILVFSKLRNRKGG